MPTLPDDAGLLKTMLLAERAESDRLRQIIKLLAGCGEVRLAFCWAHVRRGFYELASAGPTPIAAEALARLVALYRIESQSCYRNALTPPPIHSLSLNSFAGGE